MCTVPSCVVRRSRMEFDPEDARCGSIKNISQKADFFLKASVDFQGSCTTTLSHYSSSCTPVSFSWSVQEILFAVRT